MRRGATRLRFVRELALPRAERRAARAERRSESAIRRERDNLQSAERRAAAVDAEARRYQNGVNMPWTGSG
jgi:hypothetical protein